MNDNITSNFVILSLNSSTSDLTALIKWDFTKSWINLLLDKL